MTIRRLFTALPLFAVIALFASFASAQGTTSRVTGTVSDNNGAAVAGATVTLINEQTQVAVQTVTTNDSGVYLFDLVQPGSYKVTVERQGFKRYESSNNTVLVNQPATVNIPLEVGDVSAVVSVQSTAEQVQTASSGNIGGTVEQRTIEALPIVGTRGRNPLDILNFQPGVVNGANTGGGVHVNGSRDRSFNFTLDGIDINESTAGGSNFTPLRPNPDSIQEFQVVTSGFTAELGRSSGAQVTLVTRSGTNDFRGTLFEFYQSKGLMARSYASNVNGTEKEDFIQHIFGGSFSGPLFNPGFGEGTSPGWLRDRAFFFVNLQMLRASDTALQTRTVYTPLARQGIFRYVQGGTNGTGQVNANGTPVLPNCTSSTQLSCIATYDVVGGTGITLDPFLMSYINAMPLPNSYSATGDGLNTAGFLFNSPQIEKQWDLTTKFDFKLNDENQFYVRWAQGEQNTFGDAANGGRPRFPDSPNFVDTFRTPKNLAANWRWSPTSKFVNEFILGWSKFGFSFETPEPDPLYAFVFNLPTDPITNFSYNARSFRTWQFVDNMTFDFSPHVIKAGTNVRLGRSTDDRSSVAGGAIELAYTFTRTGTPFPSAWALPSGTIPRPGQDPVNRINTADRQRLESTINDLLGRVATISQAFVSDPTNPNVFAPAGTRWIFDADHPEADFYVQDTWRLSPRLILDLGLRLEGRFSPSSVGGRPMLVPDRSVVLGAAPSNGITWVEGDLFDDQWLLLPTVGFAWDPFGDGKTSIRANYRKASDRISTFLYSSFIFQSTPGNNTLGTNTIFGANGGLLRNGLPSVAPSQTPTQLRTPTSFSTSATTVIDPDLKFPAIHNWTLSFQREIWGGNVVEVNYIGKKATNLFGAYNVNQVDIDGTLPGTGETFLQAFNSIRGSSSYNSPLINLLFTGSTANNAGTTRFRALSGTDITQGSVATLARLMSQQTCTSAFITAGLCTQAQSGQRVLDLRGFGSFFQPFGQFTGGVNVVDSNDFSFYNGLEVTFKRRMRQGVSFNIGYTWALSKDTRSFDPVFTTVATGSGQSAGNTPLNNFDRRASYAWSDFDRRHSLLGTYVVELPFGKGKKFDVDNSVLNYVISGWQVAGTVRITSGRPFTVFSALNTVSNTSVSYANCSSCPRDLGGLVQGNFENTNNPNLRNWWFTPEERALFSNPLPGEVGNTGRNYFIGPSYREADISVLRNFRITERVSFDARVDARNFTNTPNFNLPSAVLPAGLDQSGFGTSIFGRINADVVNNARRVQISGRLNF
jgi:hypothetical protein